MKKKENRRNSFWTTNHSPLYYFVIFLWIVMFGGAIVFLTGQPKNSPVTLCYIGIMMIVWLLGFIIQIRERQGLSTLPGRDFRSHVNEVPKNSPAQYRLSDDGELIEIPEKPKTNPP